MVALLSFGLPIFVGFLRPFWVRILFGVLIVSIWGLLAFLRRRKAKKANDAIAAELAVPSAADQESAELNTRMAEALASLKGASGKRRDYLYSRPWYMIIGPPGAGKTTALLNSGLRFPFSDQSLKGVGGTRNLDFWFADEAALVDTAGRYTTQDSDSTTDAQGWKNFLRLLKKHRPLQPINGILVAIGVDELLKVDRTSLDNHAAAVRRRLMELRNTLEVSAPIYLLLTKADLIAGFVEYYEDLDFEGRRAVLGATLPIPSGRVDSAGFVSAFDDMVIAQSERQAKRLYEEVDQNRRSLILGFPQQLGALRSRLSRFVEGAFFSGDQNAGIFRGFYLTSGVQLGAPLDKLLSGVAEVFDQSAASDRVSGRTYFLSRLLSDVVFTEAGLVEMDAAARARQLTRLLLGFSGVVAAAVMVLGLWTASFISNRNFQSNLLASSHQVETLTRATGVDLIEVRGNDPDLEQSLTILRSLRNLPQGYVDRASGKPGPFMRFGLFQSSHSEKAIEAYHDGLRRILLPRLILRLEQYLGENSNNALALYEPLKVYLMLGGQGPMDKGGVKSWVTADWASQAFPGADRASMRKELAQHLDAMLDDPNMAAAWVNRKAPLDGGTIASARAAVQTLSLADRAYALLRQKAAASDGSDWQASNVLASGDIQAFANGDEVLALKVPYFYTRVGFEKSYQLGLVAVQVDLQKDLWVLGEDANTAGIQSQMGSVRPGVAGLYARDYIAYWDRVIATMKSADYFDNPAALGAFTKTPSPLKLVLLELRKNTTFEGGSGVLKDLATRKIKNKSRFATEASGVLAGRGDGNLDASSEISSYFKPVHEYVGDGKNPAPIDEFVASIKQAGAAMTSARMAGGGLGSEAVQTQMTMAMGTVATASAGAPPQLQSFVSSATNGGAKAQVGAAQGAISDAYAQSVLPDCKLAAQDKYPFFGGSEEDAAIVDAQRVFGMSGIVESFFQQRVMPLLDTSGPIWRWRTDSGLAMALDPASPGEFAKATQIRDLLVGGLTLEIEVQSFGGGVTAASFSSGGTNYRFDPATMEARPLIWSAQGNLPEASVILYQDDIKIKKIISQGPWALFRLMDKARRENAGPQTLLATFGEGDKSVVFKISLPSDRNPFSRGGLWSFRCPVTL